MNCKLIASDIDGTMLNSKGELTERTVAAIKAAEKKGVRFALSTGRSYQAVTEFIDVLDLTDTPCVIYNGAMIVIGGKTLYSLAIEPDVARAVVKEGHKRNAVMICWCDNKLYCEEVCEKVDSYKKISGVEPIVLKSLADVADRGITKFVWFDSAENTAKNYAELGGCMAGVNIAPSRTDFLEFVNKDCSKATALKMLADILGIDIENCVAVGDGFNDIPMLKCAGISVAMGNADDKVKQNCNIVTEDCDHDGLAAFIEKYILCD